ncbi:MAG: M48 family metallopeptidase [Phycisphaerae bacterium]|nr:M48 family metallopeptidase [Phycisphaerae bacterium]
MWEAIRQNRRRSRVLIVLMGLILVALGVTIGMMVDMQSGGVIGGAAAVGVWMIMWLVATAGGDSILLSSVGAAEIQKEDAPQLWNVVEEMTIASGMGKMPRVFIIDDDSPNAFAVGRSPDSAAVAVTSGLLKRLNRDELQGVVAHEIGHIRNLDVRFMTLAGVMVGSIVLISDVFLRSLWFSGGGRRRSSSRDGGGQAQLIIAVLAIALAILGPILAQLLYFACSRKREYLADASGARFTRYPEGLASALEKISKSHARLASTSDSRANRVVAPMYIVNPLEGRSAVGLSATHPPIETRVKILRGMGGQAGLAAYEAAYRQVTGEGRQCIDARTIEGDEGMAVRPPSVKPDTKQGAVERAREAGDLVDRMAQYLLIPCACGVRIKVPPKFKRNSLKCPRCGRDHDVPAAVAAMTAAAAIGAAARPPIPATVPKARKAEPPMRYRRKREGWESFRCQCGQTVQLSPSFSADATRCPKCNARIEIDHGG